MPQLCDANGEIAHEHTPCLRPRRQETGVHKYSLKLDCCVMLRAFGQPFATSRNKIQQCWDGCWAECCDRLAGALMSKTIAVHVRNESLFISLPSAAKQRCEMIKVLRSLRNEKDDG